MNKLREIGMFDWRRRSPIRKVQVIGALIGAFGTAGFILIGTLFHDPHNGGIMDSLGAVALWIYLPTYTILKLLGVESLLASNDPAPGILPVCLVALVNAILLSSLGGGIVWLVKTKTGRPL